ncbi:MAG: DUF192 domain-containing protein [Candidatus Staskawiczbacteria bacterium]|nr:DUF192 domain-containing protein [Candidatus Staskawiczbacteria bacterium]MBI3337043.1 DUF192 domain-containing protein [Candidatus Staskawiczbacteria bacterium]
MNSKILLITIFVLIFFLSALFLFFQNQFGKNGLSAGPLRRSSSESNRQGKVCFKEYCFDVKLAQNSAERTKGLMFQKTLEQNKGMLFLFDKEARYSFWMKNTLIPLDIIWIDKDNKVVFISENNQPCKLYICASINPTADAKYVLEVNSGIIQKIGLKLSDELSLAY